MTGPAPYGDGVFDIEKLTAIFARLVIQASSNDAHLSRGARAGEASVCRDRRPHRQHAHVAFMLDCGNLQYCQSLLSLRNV